MNSSVQSARFSWYGLPRVNPTPRLGFRVPLYQLFYRIRDRLVGSIVGHDDFVSDALSTVELTQTVQQPRQLIPPTFCRDQYTDERAHIVLLQRPSLFSRGHVAKVAFRWN